MSAPTLTACAACGDGILTAGRCGNCGARTDAVPPLPNAGATLDCGHVVAEDWTGTYVRSPRTWRTACLDCFAVSQRPIPILPSLVQAPESKLNRSVRA